MTNDKPTAEEKAAFDTVNQLDQEVANYVTYIRKIKTKLSRHIKGKSGETTISSQLSALIAALRAVKPIPESPDIFGSLERLETLLPKLRKQVQANLADDLRAACGSNKLSFNMTSNGFVVGPFLLLVDFVKEDAQLEYAKLIVAKNIPLNPNTVVETALRAKSAIIDEPVDEATVGMQIVEAMRVSAARKNKPYKSELRVELPHVFDEMTFVKGSSAARGKVRILDYSLPRFVVELKKFIQSDLNMKAQNSLRLETAVLENTKNPRKSIFIPRDCTAGYGEGTYYQAIVMTNE